ncbi:LPP20 family lipoprotein [Chitinivorax sp. B]|uniref:LPP20 family lipoprotein n=1 Tax=Chitinivorax sp. B TaxID=2502235 RepID=UPI00201800C3|nr:LPP20 family lipoprotein [Chitinivorax sp. B]
MPTFLKPLIMLIALTTLAGCGSFRLGSSTRIEDKPLRFSATGYGTMSAFEGYTAGQKRLLAMRAAKLDAYRTLAEQIYGVRIKGNTTVAALIAQNDSFRIYLDGFLRGARIVSVTPMAEGSYETEVEVELPSDFWRIPVTTPVAGQNLPVSALRPTAQSTVTKASVPAIGTPITTIQLTANQPAYNRNFYFAD